MGDLGAYCYFCGKVGPSSLPCPTCMVAMPALFCGGCGARSSPLSASCATCHAPLREPEFPPMPCPACTAAKRPSGPLARLSRGDLTLHGCTTCRGVFVPARAWCMLLSHPETAPALPSTAGGSGAVFELVGCPLCHKPLERGRFAGKSQVVVDLCERHGLWLDAGELAQILAFVVDSRKGVPNVEVAQANLEAAMRDGDAHLRSARVELASTTAPSSGRSSLVVVAAVVFALGSLGAGAAYVRKHLAPHGEDVKRAAEGAEKSLGGGHN